MDGIPLSSVQEKLEREAKTMVHEKTGGALVDFHWVTSTKPNSKGMFRGAG